jgi:hypothetical protein
VTQLSEPFQKALEEMLDRNRLASDFERMIKGKDGSIERIAHREVSALAIAIERCTPDQVAAWIQAITDDYDDSVKDARDEGYQDGRDDALDQVSEKFSEVVTDLRRF